MTTRQANARYSAFGIQPDQGGTEIFNNGYIEFALSNADSAESLTTTTAQTASISQGILTIVGTTLYRGNGSSAVAIGAIDNSINGSNGTIRFNILNPGVFSNGDFSNPTLTQIGTSSQYSIDGGWTLYNERFQIGITSVLGSTSPTDPTPATNAPSSGGQALDNATASNTIFTGTITDGQVSLPLTGRVNPGFAVLHGPYIVSTPTYIAANSAVSFAWEALGAGDAYDVFAYLLNTDNGTTVDLLNATGANASATSPLSTVTTQVTSAGNYAFVFVSGSWDASGGTVLGANLRIDNVSISPSPQTLNITAQDLNVLSTLVNYSNTGSTNAARQVAVTATESVGNGSSSLSATALVAGTSAQASSSGGGGGGGGGDSSSQSTQRTADATTPSDPAPAGTNIQATDADGDGLREVITAADGAMVDGNRDGIADVNQSEVVGLRLINDGARGSDYGALVVSQDVRLSAVTLTAPATDGTIPVTARGGGTVAATSPDGITNAFAGVVSFNVGGLRSL